MIKRAQVTLYTAFICFGIAAQIFFSRRRMSHDNGVTAAGKLKFVDDPEFPAIDLFEPGQEIGCRVRHGPASTDDDAKLLVRGCSIKFDDNRGKSPLGLLMNTGECPLFNDIKSFLEFAKIFNASAGPGGTQVQEFRGVRWIPYMQKYPGSLAHWRGAMRRNPSTYSQLYYYSKMPQHFRAKDGKERYVKFRVVPGDRGPETGLLGPDDWRTPWYYNRLPGETRSRNYLRKEFEERLEREPVVYWLQLQLHEWKEGDSRDLFDSYTIWDEATHPWMDVARIELDQLLTYEEDRLTVFTIKDRPKSMDLIAPKSLDDPNALNYLRKWAIWPRRARLLGQKVFGFAKRPDDYFWGWPAPEDESAPPEVAQSGSSSSAGGGQAG